MAASHLNIGQMLLAELRFRWPTTVLVITSVMVAVACVMSSFILMEGFDRQTNNEVEALHKRSLGRMNALENEARVFSKTLGFNIFVYPKDLDLQGFFQNDLSSSHFSSEEVHTLAKSNFPFLNHLLPILRHRYHWDEFGGDVIIGGIEGEIYIKRKWQKPLEEAIAPGEVHLGYDIYTKLGLKVGDRIQLGGKSYEVVYQRERVGSKDDTVIYMNLADAQGFLNMPNKISGILALSCNCAAGDLEPIRRGLAPIIPRAAVVEFAIRSKARAQARKAIGKATEAEIQDIAESRLKVRDLLSKFSTVLSVLLGLGCSVLMLFFYANNVKERRFEIATLRSIGLKTRQIYGLFVGKALLLALIGSALGLGLAAIVAAQLVDPGFAEVSVSSVMQLELLAKVIGCACGISLLASWVPAHFVARRAPGTIFNEG
jgi:ABC-type lipoprotein release transport system permease subunit